VHLILENYGTHQSVLIRNWLAKRPRSTFISHRRVLSGSTSLSAGLPLFLKSRSAVAFIAACARWKSRSKTYLQISNESPRPFVWTKTADEILASVARFCKRTLETGH